MTEDEQIEEIIHAIQYAIGDIELNRERTLSAFILCICCVDMLGALRFNNYRPANRWEKFATKYLHDFAGHKVYSICRNKLVHSYSSNKTYGVTNDPAFLLPLDTINGKLIVNTNYLIDSIKVAAEKIKAELRIKGETRTNALLWDTNNPLFRHTTI